MNNLKLLLFSLLSTFLFSCEKGNNKISSPNDKISLNYENEKFYVSYNNSKQPVFEITDYGIVTNQINTSSLTLTNISKPKKIEENYEMISGKRKMCSNIANAVTFQFKTEEATFVNIIFRLYDDGFAFK